MKNAKKPDHQTRRLRLQREVIVELKPRQLADVVGGLSTNPRCTDPWEPVEV